VGGGWALEFSSFLGPVKWHRADRHSGTRRLETEAKGAQLSLGGVLRLQYVLVL
jgi:hypothetical protein